MKFGLVGTGHWARVTHGAALAEEPEVDFEAVWGRDAERTAALASHLGVQAAPSYDALLEQVDAVAFSVPPEVQADLAVRAAQAGRHLLLEKPISMSSAGAQRLEEAVDEAGVSSLVFFTAWFDPARRAWLEDVAGGPWQGGWARWFAANFEPDSPYAASAWRWDRGALWDIGPHLLAALMPALGPVTRVVADAGAGDLVHLVLHHESGATSTVSTTLRAPREAAGSEVGLWGGDGVSFMPPASGTSVEALRRAARELTAAVSGDGPHLCDVHFGRAVTEVLAQAERGIAAD